MSGGFFRGTSADQDTRFSNKQAKLLKSQKFAPELEHLVDMTKVKMDVIRPWIATRVTELLGFEDEVLINFIYGLLDGKEVNGKEVQISLTGFMEKNTGKFMKELWALLLSAQRNASGVPQQFLDAKEEEARMKKAESDRIANEIQKKKDKDKKSRELEQERDDGDERKAGDAGFEHSSKNMLPKGSSACHEEERDADQRNGLGRKRVSQSPCSTGRSPSPRRSLSRSVSRSFSKTRSYSDGKGKSRSVSRSPQPRRSSISFDKTYRSPRRSPTPRSRYSSRSSRSLARQSSSYSRRRSRSHSPRRSPSPIRRRLRSPYRYGFPSPIRHRRSPSPIRRHRSPPPIRRHRSPSPIRRRRSPPPIRRRRSPSPIWRRRSPSPIRHRRSPSPVQHHRSPVSMRHRRSPSLVRHHRSPLDVHRVSRSPVHRKSPSPTHSRSSLPVRCRSPSPLLHRSPSLVQNCRRRSSSTPRHRSSSPKVCRSPASRRRSITPSHGKSPSPYQSSSASPVQHRSSTVRRFQKDQRSPLLSPGEIQRMSGKLSPVSGSPSHLRKQSTSEDRSPMRQGIERIARDDSFSPERKLREFKGQQDSKGSGSKNGASRIRHSLPASKQRVSPRKVYAPERLTGSRSTKSRKDLEMKSEKSSGKGIHLGTPDQQRSPALSQDSFQGEKQSASHLGAGKRSDEKSRSRQNNMKDNDKHHKAETLPMSLEKFDHNNDGLDSGSEGSDKQRTKHKERRKHKRSERREVTSDDESSSDSEIEDKKEAKRRRKEEKRSRKEEKRRRREERRRRREERRAEKHKMKGQDNDDEDAARRKSHPSFGEEAETGHKKLEIELRNRALESLKAKKGITG